MQFIPKAIPPFFTFGQDIFNSIKSTLSISFAISEIFIYSSSLSPFILRIIGALYFIFLIILSLKYSIPGFSKPMQLIIPEGVSAILIPLFPSLLFKVIPFKFTAPSLSTLK